MKTEIRSFIEALVKEDYAEIHDALGVLLDKGDEDILVIAIRELVARGILTADNKKATVVSGIILDHEPRRSLLAKFARKLGDPSMRDDYLAWMDNVLAKNVGLEPDEWLSEWTKLESVNEIDRIIFDAQGGEHYE